MPAVALRIFSNTTAQEVCQMVVQKLKLPSNSSTKCAIIMLYTVHQDEHNGAIQQVLHTLGDGEKPVQLQERAMSRCRDLAAERHPNTQPPSLLQAEDVIHWFFRDSRSSPLELEHDASGSEASEDEAATKDHPQDLSHLNDDNCTRCAGFLLKRSAHDPNLWRKRFCILAGDKLWYMRRRPQRSRGQLMYVGKASS